MTRSHPLRLQPLPALLLLSLAGSGAAHAVAGADPGGAPAQDVRELASMPFEDLVRMRTVTAASKFEQLISDAPAAVVVLDASDIRQFGWRTLADALATLPGLYISNDRNYSYLGARGFLRPGDYNGRFLLMIDGTRVNDAVYDQALIGQEGMLDMALVRRIEFVPGAGSAVHGSNALFGVINVVTKDGSTQSGLRAAAGVGSHGERQARVSWGWHGQNGADLLLAASTYEQDGQDHYYPEYDTPVEGFTARPTFPPPKEPTGGNGWARGLDTERANRVFLKASYGPLRVSLARVERHKEVPTAAFGAVFNKENWTRDAQTSADLAFQRTLAPDLALSARVWYGKSDYLGFGHYPMQDGVSRNVDGGHGRWYGGSAHATYTGLPRQTILVGAEVGRDARQEQFNFNLDPYLSVLDDRRSSNRRAVYVEDEIRLSDKLLLNAGLRHDHHRAGASSTTPRLALLYRMTPADTVKLLYGRAFRAPNVYEMYYAIAGDAGAMRANPELEPERISTSEVVLEHAMGAHGHATVSLFHYRLRGLIGQAWDEEASALVFRNDGSATAMGAEAAIERNLRGGARIRASYAWQRAHGGELDESLVNSPRHLAKVNVVSAGFGPGARLAGELLCMSARQTQNASTGGHCVTNLTLTVASLLPGADLSVSLFNATGKRYGDPAGPAFLQEAIEHKGRSLHAQLAWQL